MALCELGKKGEAKITDFTHRRTAAHRQALFGERNFPSDLPALHEAGLALLDQRGKKSQICHPRMEPLLCVCACVSGHQELATG